MHKFNSYKNWSAVVKARGLEEYADQPGDYLEGPTSQDHEGTPVVYARQWIKRPKRRWHSGGSFNDFGHFDFDTTLKFSKLHDDPKRVLGHEKEDANGDGEGVLFDTVEEYDKWYVDMRANYEAIDLPLLKALLNG